MRYASNTATTFMTMRCKSVIAIIRVNTIISITTVCTTVRAIADAVCDCYTIACPATGQPDPGTDARLRIVHRRASPARITGHRVQRDTGTATFTIQQQPIEHTVAVGPDYVYATAAATVLASESMR